MKRRTDYKQCVCDILGNDYTISTNLKDDEIRRNTRIIVTHIPCGYSYKTSVSSIIGGSKCPKCEKILSANKRRKTPEEFKTEVFALVGNEYSVDEAYKGATIPIKFTHKVCGNTFYMRPSNFLNGTAKGKLSKGNRCPICEKTLKLLRARNRIKKEDCFKQEVKSLVGDHYSVLGQYIGARKKIKFVHNECGHEFFMTPNKFLSGRRCPYCLKKSNEEKRIYEYLTNAGIKYTREYWTPALKDQLPLRYDFRIFYGKKSEKYFLLEYQGKQHYVSVDYFGGEKSYEKRCSHDAKKREYAKENKIPLEYITYKDNTLSSLKRILGHYKLP